MNTLHGVQSIELFCHRICRKHPVLLRSLHSRLYRLWGVGGGGSACLVLVHSLVPNGTLLCDEHLIPARSPFLLLDDS